MNHRLAVIAEMLMQTEMHRNLARQPAGAFQDLAAAVDHQYILRRQLPLLALPGQGRRHAENIADAQADVAAAGVGQVTVEEEAPDARHLLAPRPALRQSALIRSAAFAFLPPLSTP